ncbi:MAG TPA: cupin domain-containing protein [Actinomycetota bacterium]|nr:cupin domain-containing protein [Actinomycetota bacterium]
MTIAAPSRGAETGHALARCTGDARRFLDEDWQRRARVYRTAEPGGFDDLLTLDDVDRFLTTTALRTPFFRLVQAGERIPEASYTRSGRAGSRDVAGIADPARVAACFEAGATIVLQGVHRWSEPVMRFTRDLELELGFPCQVNAYITPAGARGLDRHADPHDVFVLQAFGCKRWQVHPAPGEPERPALDEEIGPGDTIYMPTGTPHAASAQRTVSGHLTVGVHVATWRDVFTNAWTTGAASDASLDEPLPAGWHLDPGRHRDELAARFRAAADRLASLDPEPVLERRAARFLSGRAQLARGSIVERAAPIEPGDATVVRRRPGSVCIVQIADGELAVLLGDRRLRMPAWLEPAMRTIADAEYFRVGDLDHLVPDAGSRAVLVRRLIREGLLTAAPGRAPGAGTR